MELDEAGSRLDEQNTASFALQAQYAASLTEIADLTSACATLDSNIDRLNSELETNAKSLVESNDAFESQQITLTTLEAENISAKSQLERMSAQIISLEGSSLESQSEARTPPPAPCCLFHNRVGGCSFFVQIYVLMSISSVVQPPCHCTHCDRALFVTQAVLPCLHICFVYKGAGAFPGAQGVTGTCC